MDQTQFELQLKKDGFQEVATRTMEPRPANDEHTHDCTIRGLVTQGEFIITFGDDIRRYTNGEIFEVAAGIRHSEAIGPDGATVIIGRRFLTT